jgi:hypothetical protein
MAVRNFDFQEEYIKNSSKSCHQIGRCMLCLVNQSQIHTRGLGYCIECENANISSAPSTVYSKCAHCKKFHAYAIPEIAPVLSRTASVLSRTASVLSRTASVLSRTTLEIMEMLEANSSEINLEASGSSKLDVSCPVCLGHFTAKKDIVRTKCKHQFCKSCIQKWLENDHHTCPLCRTRFT